MGDARALFSFSFVSICGGCRMRLYVRSRLRRGLGGRLVVHVADNLTRFVCLVARYTREEWRARPGLGSGPAPAEDPGADPIRKGRRSFCCAGL